MNTTHRLLFSFALIALGSAPALSAADAPAKPKNGYTVLMEVQMDENGTAEGAKVISSDDTSLDRLLERNAFRSAHDLKLPPHLKDGKAVKFAARVPYFFAVEGDEGPEDPTVIKPKILNANRPVYTAEAAAKGEVGAVILEIMVGADGKGSDLKVLRGSGPVFEKAAMDAVSQWTFVPAVKEGSPIASRWRMSICFETDVLAADWSWRLAPRPSLGNFTVVHQTKPVTPSTTLAPIEPAPATAPAEKK